MTNLVTVLKTTATTIHDAQRLYRTGQFEASNEVLFKLNAVHGPNKYRQYLLGRNYRALRDPEKARLWLGRAISGSTPFARAYYEMALLHVDADDFVTAAGLLIRFLVTARDTQESDGLDSSHFRSVCLIAHKCFEVDRTAASDLYRQMDIAGFGDYLVRLRTIEALLADPVEGQIGIADAKMARLRQDHALCAWGSMADSRIHQLQGRVEESLAAAMNAVKLAPQDAFLKRVVCHRLMELGRPKRPAR
jgi:hypothetical protein